MCESFNCLPDEAERQHWPTMQAIMEHRTATRVAELMRSDDGGSQAFSESAPLRHWRNILMYGEDIAARMMENEQDEDEE